MSGVRPFIEGVHVEGGLVPEPGVQSPNDAGASKVVVLGAGISGLTSAILLQETGRAVEIWARDLSPATTSDVAGAAWYPYRATSDDFNQLGQVTRQALDDQRVRFGSDKTGIITSDVIELHREAMGDPAWATAAEDFHHATRDELPAGYEDGLAFRAPVVDMGRYLSFLRSSFVEAGGTIVVRSVASLSDVFAECPTVVNCTGLGSRELIGDTDIHPARGQVVRVRKRGDEGERVLIDESDGGVTYVIPRIDDIVLGGTFEEGNYDLTVDPAQTADILERVRRLDPKLGEITEEDIITVAVGLRPIRSSLKLDAERPTPETVLVNNIGHGGSGVTLSWGCAAAVVKMVSEMGR